ncbi:double-stranded RNA-binding protein 1-like isoform X2 [Glycine soja]|uniref:double-stranded RNA binding motif-containing protein isoform X1 n=1 Tax=Glycine max TaxID=3847 RepID=UPI00103B8CA5|nr:double-stranded RNA binding motif-containing protein isoform X1 [Glycine max]XP_028232004.1 double-stranded RNA-binding protein 1-like isoform X2 [Glycine soja]
MYKTRLQELCQRRSWTLPTYDNSREGPDHNPRFTSTVNVNGVSFHTPSPTRSAKQAQNDAAMLAFLHFSPPSPSTSCPTFPQHSLSISALSSFPQPSLFASSSGSPDPSSVVDDILLTNGVLQPKLEEVCQTSQISGPVIAVRDTITAEDQKNMLHLYKNQLQSYVQKNNLSLPVYSSEWEGPPHAMRFKCKVTVDGQTYESDKFYSTLKDAEHAAAEAALISLSPGRVQEGHVGLYKNLLQELAQKEGFRLPIYNTNKSGEAHMPIFVSQVEVEGELFTGEEAKSKKQAEMSAAKVAYMALKECKGKSDKSSSFPFSTHKGQAPEFSSDHSESNVVTALQYNADPNSLVDPGLVTWNQHSKDKLKNVSSSSENTNGCTEDSSLSSDKSAPSLSGSTKVVSDSSNTYSTAVERVVVYSRKTNVEIEDGGTILPISDDRWVAYSYSH